MITKYKINGDTLVLELNFDYEFGSFDKKDLENLYDQVTSFIKSKKIKFKGDKILLIASGILIGTIYLSNTYIKDLTKSRNNYNITNSIVELLENRKKELFNIDNSRFIQNDVIEINVEDIEENIDNKEEVVSIENNNTDTELNSNYNNKNNSTNKNTNSNVITNNNNSNNNNNPEINKQEEVKVNQTMITLYRSNGSVETIELEQYLIGVLAAEMPASFHLEALKAQAVVARTYTLKLMNEGRKLTDTSSTQNYITTSEMKNKWGGDYSKYYDKIKNAVETTKGVYVTYNNKPIDAVYHSTNNGYTESSVNVWGNSIPYLQSVSSPYDKVSSQYLREINLSFSELNTLLGTNFSIDSIINSNRSNTEHVSKITIDNNSYTGINFRTLLNLRSTDFDININETGFVITTRGYGHAVGMSQYGANGMANNGSSYRQIINHYYTNVTISNLY